MNERAHKLAVLIATHNRREMLRRCLSSLALQTQDPTSFEVIVVDDGSGDGTAEMVDQLETPYRLRVMRIENSGKSAALNAAIPTSVADVCLFIDDDIVASPQLVAEHLKAHRKNPMALAIGALTQEPPPSPDWFSYAYATAWNKRYEEMAAKHPDWPDCYGANFSAPRAALLESGAFSVDLPAVEDVELAFRLCKIGCVPTYLPNAHAVHDDHKSRRRILADTRGFGAFCAEFTGREPDTYRKLLGWFGDTTARDLAVRRLLLAVRASPTALAKLGRLIPGAERRQIWFSFISRHSFWLGVRSRMSRGRWAQSTRGVPVLMYHAFTEGSGGNRFVLPRRAFARQMRLLAALRYRVIPLEELLRALREQRALPPRAAVITIDDGYVDNLQVAQPVLRRHAFPATIFLVSRRLGKQNDWDTDGDELGDRPLLTVEEVQRMRDGNVRVGAHSQTHRSLPDTTDEIAAQEIQGSGIDLEAALGAPVTSFAYPFGRLDDRIVALVDRSGYLGACTAEPHLVHCGTDPLNVPRIEVRASDSMLRFLRKLWLGGQ